MNKMMEHNGKFINNNCTRRVKPTLLRDVKTEALLLFCRTALERYFEQLNDENILPFIGSKQETDYVYGTLKRLTQLLQECVVNVDYILDVVEHAGKDPKIFALWKKEAPLIEYYNTMAITVERCYEGEPAYLPEFMVSCVLSHWILEEKKSVSLYPFLADIDYLELIGVFESNRSEFIKNGECHIDKIYKISEQVVESLKRKKFKPQKTVLSRLQKRK